MLLIASVFVITMIVWMNRVARHLKKEIEQKVEAYAERAGSAAGWAFSFSSSSWFCARGGAGADSEGRGAFQ